MPAKRVKRWSIGRNKERLKKKKEEKRARWPVFVTVGKEADRRRRKPEEGREGKKRKSKRGKREKKSPKTGGRSGGRRVR